MKVKAQIINETTLELLEDAKNGDYIDLKDLVKVDTSFLNKKIEEEATAIYQKNLNEKYELEIKAYKHTQETKINELEAKYKDNINNLTKEFELKIRDLNNELNNKNTILEHKVKDKENELKLKYTEQITKLELSNQAKDNILEQKVNELNREYSFKIKELNDKIKNLTESKDLELENQKLIIEQNYNNKITNLNNDITNLKNELNNAKLAKSSLNIKKIGEQLENWCNEEYLNYAVVGFKNCTWEKDNTAIREDDDKKENKTDYIFKVYLDNKKETLLTSVCCEMKNEDPMSKNKKKNSDHYNKLNVDRNKKGCEYALLISELEWDSDNDAPIKVVNEYEKMYMVRPQYFIAFLGIIYSLAEKYRDILLAKESEELALKDKKELATEFDELLNTYINKPIEGLEKKVNEILKQSQIITTANQKIIDSCNEIINKTIITIKEKINTLDIKKMPKFYKSLDKVNNM